jgi:hypothetical protein
MRVLEPAVMSGPPESPPAASAAQTMLEVMDEVPYWDWQVARETMGTLT